MALQGLRWNNLHAVGAARAGQLITLSGARSRHQYIKIALLDRADLRRAPPEVVELRRAFLAGGRSGIPGTSQAMDAFHEESERLLKHASASPARP